MNKTDHFAQAGIISRKKASVNTRLNIQVKNARESTNANTARKSTQAAGLSIRSASVRGSRRIVNDFLAVGGQGIVSHHGHLM